MNPTRLACDGITVGAVCIPPFQLASQECICLHLPDLFIAEEHNQILQVLTAERPVPGVHFMAKVVRADIPVVRRGLFGFFRRPRPVDWLRSSAGISKREAEVIVVRLRLDPRWSVGQLARNPRTLLGLEAAWARSADVVVFSTVGCDPSGIRSVYEAVTARLDRSAAIHLSYPFWHNGHDQRECFPGARCISASRPAVLPKTVSRV